VISLDQLKSWAELQDLLRMNAIKAEDIDKACEICGLTTPVEKSTITFDKFCLFAQSLDRFVDIRKLKSANQVIKEAKRSVSPDKGEEVVVHDSEVDGYYGDYDASDDEVDAEDSTKPSSSTDPEDSPEAILEEVKQKVKDKLQKHLTDSEATELQDHIDSNDFDGLKKKLTDRFEKMGVSGLDGLFPSSPSDAPSSAKQANDINPDDFEATTGRLVSLADDVANHCSDSNLIFP
jgi:hypothetical protein